MGSNQKPLGGVKNTSAQIEVLKNFQNGYCTAMPDLVTANNPWPDGRGHLLTGSEGQAVHVLDTAIRACSLYPGYYAAVDDFLTRTHKETNIQNFFKNVVGIDPSAFMSYKYTDFWTKDTWVATSKYETSPFATHNRICMQDKAAGGPVSVTPFSYPTPQEITPASTVSKNLISGHKDLHEHADAFMNRNMDYFTVSNIDFILWQVPTVTASSALKVQSNYTSASSKVTSAINGNNIYKTTWNFMSAWSKIVIHAAVKRKSDLATIYKNYNTALSAMTLSTCSSFMGKGRNALVTINTNKLFTSATIASMNTCISGMVTTVAKTTLANLKTVATATTATAAQKAVWNFYSAWSSVAPASLTKTSSVTVTVTNISKIQTAFVPVTSHVLSATCASYATNLCTMYNHMNTLARSNATTTALTSNVNTTMSSLVTKMGSGMTTVQKSGNDCLSKYYTFLSKRTGSFSSCHTEGKEMIGWLYSHIPEILSNIEQFLGLSSVTDEIGNPHRRWCCYLNFFTTGHSVSVLQNTYPDDEAPPGFNLNFTMPPDYQFTSTVTDDPMEGSGQYRNALLVDFSTAKTFADSNKKIAMSGGTWHYGITNLISLQHEFTHALAYCNRYQHSGAISLLFTEGLADTLSQQISKLMNKNGISGSDWAKTIKLRGTTNWLSTRQSYISLALNSAATIIARTGDVTLAKGTKIWILLSKITDAMKNTKANIVFKQDDVFYDETNKIWYSVLLDSTVNVTVPKQVTETGAATFPTARPYCDWESYLYYPKRYSKDTDFDGDMCYSGGSMFLRFICNAVIKGWDETYLINNYSKYQKIYGWPSNPYRTKKDTAAKK